MGLSSRSRCLALVAVAALMCSALAACGSDDKSSSGSSTTKPASTGKKAPIKIGFVTDSSGAYGAVFAPALSGAKAYASQINAKGGIDGHPIDMVSYDTQSSATAGASVARRIDSDGVFIVASASQFLDSGISYLVQKGIPVAGWGVSPNWFGPDKTSMFAFNGNGLTATTTAWVNGPKEFFNASKYAIVSDPSEGSDAANKQWSALIKSTKGLSEVFNQRNVDTTDTASLLAIAQKVKDSEAQVVMSTMGAGNPDLQANLIQVGSKAAVVAGAGYSPVIPEKYKGTAEGFTYGGQSASVTSNAAGVKQYRAAMQKYQPKDELEGFAPLGYMSMWFAAYGIEQAIAAGNAQPTQADVITALNHTQGFDFDGLGQPIHFPEFHTQPGPCIAFSEVKGDKWVALNQGKFSCGEAFPPS